MYAVAMQDGPMLIHPWDEATREEWHERRSPHADFGQLVTAGHVDGYPVVVPTHFLYDGEDDRPRSTSPGPTRSGRPSKPTRTSCSR